MTREELLKKLDNKEYESSIKYPKGRIISERTILDENLTIKKNKKLVKKKNEEYRAERQKWRHETKVKELEFQNDVVDYVLTQCKHCTKKQIEKIEEYISMDGEFSSKREFLFLVEEFAQRFDELTNLK